MSIKLLSQILDNPIPFAHALGHTLLTEIHAEWIRAMFYLDEDKTLQAHRDSFKTTCLIVALDLCMIAKPTKNQIVFRKDEKATREVLRSVRKDLDSDVIRSLVKRIYNVNLKCVIDGANEIQTNLYKGPKECQLIGMGIKGGVTGLHGNLYTDDIVTVKDRVSQAEREYTTLFYHELQNVAGRTGRIGNQGTPWHKDDTFTAMPIATKYDIYSTGIYSKEEIEKKKGSMPGSLFAANYELKHIADGDILFPEPQYGKFPEGARTLAHIDAAYGGEDKTALTIIAEVDGKLHVIGWMMSGHIENHFNEIVSKMERFQCHGYDCENNADKGFLRKDLSRLTSISGTGYHEKMNKYYKISTYGKARWKDVIFDLEGGDPEYIAEIMDYNENAGHDDAPDSFASLVKRRYYTNEQSFH
jgi:hypothetical protein